MFDLDATSLIFYFAVAWGVCLFVVLRLSLNGGQTVGLPIAFLVLLSVNHFGALVHLIDSYQYYYNPYLVSWNYTKDTVATGFGTSLVGVIAFTIGIGVANALDRSHRSASDEKGTVEALPKTARIFLFAGFFAAAIGALARAAGIPGMDAVIQTLWNGFLAAAIGYGVYHFRLGARRRAAFHIFVTAAFLPLWAILLSGILADATGNTIILISFYAILVKPSMTGYLRGAAVLLVFTYVAVLAGTGWLQIRSQIRENVDRDTSLERRVSILFDALSKVDVFSASQSQLEYLDMRMNQNVIVGKAVETLQQGSVGFENGSVIAMAFLGWVPRALWPGKPERGGSAAVVKYTGKVVTSAVTFGTGPIFDAYLDFGNFSVFAVMGVYGFILRRLDRRAGAIMTGDYSPGWVIAFMSGAAMISALNSLFFIVSSVVAAALISWAIVSANKTRLSVVTARSSLSARTQGRPKQLGNQGSDPAV
jgi:hypothetical protein